MAAALAKIEVEGELNAINGAGEEERDDEADLDEIDELVVVVKDNEGDDDVVVNVGRRGARGEGEGTGKKADGGGAGTDGNGERLPGGRLGTGDVEHDDIGECGNIGRRWRWWPPPPPRRRAGRTGGMRRQSIRVATLPSIIGDGVRSRPTPLSSSK